MVSEVFEEVVEDRLDGPVFVIDYPAAICPLTKRKAADPAVAERFELFVRGMELANAYTELNDPLMQEALFRQQLAGLADEDSMAKMDDDFVRALKHAMPPAGGLGVGIDRLCMLLMNRTSIRDVILFPLLRPAAVADLVVSGSTSSTRMHIAEVERRPIDAGVTVGPRSARTECDCHVQVPALLAVSPHPLHRAGQHHQRDARRGDDDRRQLRHGRLLREDARPAARRPGRRRRRVASTSTASTTPTR